MAGAARGTAGGTERLVEQSSLRDGWSGSRDSWWSGAAGGAEVPRVGEGARDGIWGQSQCWTRRLSGAEIGMATVDVDTDPQAEWPAEVYKSQTRESMEYNTISNIYM
ncbi:hypothetical protein UY3_15009 [Chelonia mydas]|uniref:Uncharacterized protein n=1 Tax=Chelonia mydas TaxID=8469 RepID=M7ARD7_CHEMY|nr:hypothetical protein UY3_15009 [Chelonia mydas]